MTEPPIQPEKKWYHSNWSLALAFITIGPLMLPLVWKNPRFSSGTKWLITSVALTLTVVLCWGFGYFVKNILAYYQQLSEINGL